MDAPTTELAATGGRGSNGKRTSEPLLVARHVSKHFGGAVALSGVDFEVRAGEVHALVGANGSGKSTLVKVMCGAVTPDSGDLVKESSGLVITAVHQELGLFEEGTVVENVLANRGTPKIIRPRRERRIVRELLRELGVQIDVRRTVRELSAEQRVTVAVARALIELANAEHAVMIVDEATSILRGRRAKELLDVVRRLAARGLGIVFVSHDLDEVLHLADRVTVLRDGNVQAEIRPSGTERAAIVDLMVGGGSNRIDRAAEVGRGDAKADAGGAVALDVQGLSGAQVAELSFQVKPSEVVGLTGVAGSGYDEVPYLVVGAVRRTGGMVRIGERKIRNPAQFAASGGRIVPAKRQDALVLLASVYENTFVSEGGGRGRFGISRRSAERRWVSEILGKYEVKCASPSVPISTLSGGNQQKVVLGRCFEARPKVLVLHEPTQGVDVVARADLLKFIRTAARELGVGVLYVSAEVDELSDMCARVLVMRRGRIAGELCGDRVGSDAIHALLY
jgi:ribose transport system ATP-binding protein